MSTNSIDSLVVANRQGGINEGSIDGVDIAVNSKANIRAIPAAD
jgi:hypothetical protein